MADNVAVTEGAGKTIRTDDVGGAQVQIIKVAVGGDGVATDVTTAAPFPVEDTNSDALLTAAQAIQAAVEVLDNTVAGSETQVDVVSSALPSGAATAANQAAAIGHLATIAGAAGDGLTDAELRASPVPVSGTVTASGPLTDVQLRASAVPVLDTNSAALLTAAQAIQTAAEILDNIVAGTEAQVDVVAALPSGTNTIGKAIIVDGAGADPEFAKEGDIWNAADHGMILFARDTDTNPDTYRAVQVDANGHLKVANDALPAGDNNIGNVDIASALPAGTNLIGTVGAPDIVITVTPTLDTNAYTSGDLLFDSTEIANAVRVNGGTAILQSVTIIDKDDQLKAMKLIFADAATDFGTVNSPPDPDDTEAATVIGHYEVSITDTSQNIDLGTASVHCCRNIGLLLQAGASTTSIWVAAMTMGTPTHSASGLVLKLGFLRS